jgi:outer membrane protein insertion porin family/translocation and assembly module TamA
LLAEVVAKNPVSGNGVAITLGAEAATAPGDGSDIKLDEQFVASIPLARRVSLATRVRFGQLFPGNYGESLRESPNPRDQELMLFRAFYSGGADSNRGYGYREVGPHGSLTFLTPSSVCPVETTTPACFKPLGGMRLWEASLELRIAIIPPWVGAWFIDASDVTLAGMRLSHPHLSTGFGTRIPTPVGLARIDLGFRVPYMQAVGQARLPLEEGRPSTILTLPLALHLSVGQTL